METFTIYFTNSKPSISGEAISFKDFVEANHTNLAYADLSNQDLTYINLQRADLSYANLTNTNLSYSNLSYANLSNANCTNCSFTSSYFYSTRFNNADLTESNFINTAMESVTFTNAVMDDITMNWNSHDLISEILFRAATTIGQEQFAAWISHKKSWCWPEWLASNYSDWNWVLATLQPLVKPSDNAPSELTGL